MKICLLVVLIACCTFTGCAAVPPQNDSWFGRDKASHFLVSGLISGTATVIADKQGMNRYESFYFAFGTTLSLGAGKETYDLKIRKTGWSWKDLFWDALGALAGYGIIQAVD